MTKTTTKSVSGRKEAAESLAGRAEKTKQEFEEAVEGVQEALSATEEPKTELDKKEKAELKKQEAIIQKGHDAFLDSCEALHEIEANDLWFGYVSFPEYCALRWDMSSTDVSRVRNAVQILAILRAEKYVLPKNEAQCRMLHSVMDKFDEKRMISAWKKVVASNSKSGKPITAAAISKAGKMPVKEKKESAKRNVSFEASSPLAHIEKIAHEKGKTSIAVNVRCNEEQATLLCSSLNATKTGEGDEFTLMAQVDDVETAFARFGAWQADHKITAGQFSFAVK